MVMVVQVSVAGLYLAPVFKKFPEKFSPPQTIISFPVHTAVSPSRGSGAFTVVVAAQVSVQSPGSKISGSVYAGTAGGFLNEARNNKGSIPIVRHLTSRSARIGLARHSATTKGSFPSAARSSRNTPGCFV